MLEKTVTLTSSAQFFDLIEAERLRQGLSHEEMALQAGMSHAAYGNARSRGSPRLSLNAAIGYATVLGIQLKLDASQARRRKGVAA
jgi:transcriptional regulator with XRE-family HTH domain